VKAVITDPQGSLDEIRLGDVPDPSPQGAELLVAVEAATVNPVDVAAARGLLDTLLPESVSAPHVPGWDLVGRVEAVGPDGDRSLLGTRVLGFSQWFHAARGTHAERVALSPESIAPIGETIAPEEATTFGLNGLTALWALDLVSDRGQGTLLVTGGTGAVGGFVIQAAAAAGWRVFTVGRAADRARLMALGAEAVFDRDGDLGAAARGVVPEGVDALVAAAPSDQAALAAVRRGGVATAMQGPLEPEREIEVRPTWVQPDSALLARVATLAQAGVLTPRIGFVAPASEAARAFSAVATATDHRRVVLRF
jgi:NADPH:quinone reductase